MKRKLLRVVSKKIDFQPRLGYGLLLVISIFLCSLGARAQIYVSTSGDDGNPGTEAQPKQTIQAGIDAATSGQIVYVANGTYTLINGITINKSISLIGNNLDINNKPLINGDGNVANKALIEVDAPDVTIQNFELQIAQDGNALNGITTLTTDNFNNLTIADNIFKGTKAYTAGFVWTSHAIKLGRGSAGIPGGVPNNQISIVRNTITYNNLTAPELFGRGIYAFNTYGKIGGSAIDANTIVAVYALQGGEIGGGTGNDFEFSYNDVRAGWVSVVGAEEGNHKLNNNTVGADITTLAQANAMSRSMEVKGSRSANANIEVADNTIYNYTNIGLFLQRSDNITVRDNVFNPFNDASNTSFRSLVFSSKEGTGGAQSPVTSNNITIVGNTFNGSGNTSGTGIAFFNHNGGALVKPLEKVKIGGAGTDKNIFHADLASYIALDPSSGEDTQSGIAYPYNALYDIVQNPTNKTNVLPFSSDVIAEFNVFGAIDTEADKTPAALSAVKTKIIDKGIYANLGEVFLYLPIKNLNTSEGFVTIQSAIDAPATVNGHVIEVAAGTYEENITVTKELDIRGPNYGISPNGGTRVAEAILLPATSSDDGDLLKVRASNVTIDGFTFNGDNPALTSTFIGTNGADIDAASALVVDQPNINFLKVSNNDIKNFGYFGVQLYGSAASEANTSKTGHLVKDNKFSDLGYYNQTGTGYNRWGGGILLYNSHYARVEDNVMLNVRTGIQTGNFQTTHTGDPDYQVIQNNTIQARGVGIFYNLHRYSPYTIKNNTITGIYHADEVDSPTRTWIGMLLGSLGTASMGESILENNTIDPTAAILHNTVGINVWNVRSDSPAKITGGSISNVNTGIFLNNYEGYNTNADDGANANISGVSIAPNAGGIGIRMLDSPNSTSHADVEATLGDGISITGGAHGVTIENANAKVNPLVGNISFAGQTGDYFRLIANANNIDATATIIETVAASTMNAAAIVAVETKVTDKDDDVALGQVFFRLPVTNVTKNIKYLTIQEAIDAADAGDEITTLDGEYLEDVSVNKANLKLIGPGASSAIIKGVKGGSATTLSLAATGVVVEGFTITRDGNNAADWNNANGTLNNQGVSMDANNTTVRNLVITGNRNGLYINNRQNVLVENSDITNNRTGVHTANNITGTIIRNNNITNNWTMGFLYIDPSDPVNGVGATTSLDVVKNNITGNWYSQIEFRTNNVNVLNFGANYLGSGPIAVSTDPSGEPGYAAQIPTAFGGGATAPGTSYMICGVHSSKVDYSVALANYTDTDPAIGFQPDSTTVWVYEASPVATLSPKLTSASKIVAPNGTIVIKDATITSGGEITKDVTLDADFASVTIDGDLTVNTTALTLAKATTVEGNFALDKGKISPSADFTLNGSITATPGINNFIDGQVTVRNVSADILIPIGKGSKAAYIELVGTSGTIPSTFTAEYFPIAHSSSVKEAGLTSVSANEYWTLNHTWGDLEAQVKLYSFDLVASGIPIGTLDDAVVAQYVGAQWESQGQSANSNTSPYYVTASTASTTFGDFTFGSNISVLPVELLNFTAQSTTGGALIKWTTSKEENNVKFEVEKSLNGKDFVSIGEQAAAGGVSGASYQFLDASFKASAYYRLVQVDANGTRTTYHNLTKFVKGLDANAVTVYPNPVASTVYVNLGSVADESVKLVLTDISGRVQKTLNTFGSGHVALDVTDVNSGTYVLQIIKASGSVSMKIVKL